MGATKADFDDTITIHSTSAEEIVTMKQNAMGLPLITPKYCAHCASTNYHSADEKCYRCEDCGYVFFQNVAATANAVIRVGDEVCLVVRNHNPGKGGLDTPGGFLEPKETLEAGLLRELREEIGLAYKGPLRYLGSTSNEYIYKQVKYHTLDSFFEITLNTKPTLQAADDAAEIEWVSIIDFPWHRLAFDSVRQFLKSL